jgi:5-methylcytosine-specific restriction enzyme A
MPLKVFDGRVSTMDPRRVLPPPKQADPYYTSTAHQLWRDAVIAKASGRCEFVDTETGKRCAKAVPRYRMFADHIKERRDGGDPLLQANGQCLCGAHYTAKTAQERARRAFER